MIITPKIAALRVDREQLVKEGVISFQPEATRPAQGLGGGRPASRQLDAAEHAVVHLNVTVESACVTFGVQRPAMMARLRKRNFQQGQANQ
jgi:hypothetical protein